MTLDEALREARSANARLPIPVYEEQRAREQQREAAAERWLQLSLEGGFLHAPASGYDPTVTNLGEDRLLLVGSQPLYDGGARRSAVARARASVLGAAARYRVAVRDVDLEVRLRFSDVLATQDEVGARRRGLERLGRYRDWLAGRRAAGQGVAVDLLKTDVRLATERAALTDAEGRAAQARLALNDLLGRDPEAPLELAPLPAPEPPPTAAGEGQGGEAWRETPDLEVAAAASAVGEAELRRARAERKPALSLTADVGLWGADTTRLVPSDITAGDPDAGLADRLRRDAGYSLGIQLSWSLDGFGAIRARIAQAELGVEQAHQEETVERRRARLGWEAARAALDHAYRQIESLSGAVPAARDAYLETESRYRGGAASALEVLDAYADSVSTAVSLSEALLRYRTAQAMMLRWGGS